MQGDSRQRTPRLQLVGYENDHAVVLRTGKPRFWVVRCKHCGGEHEQNGREIQRNAHTRRCPQFRPHNHSGLERWDCTIRRVYGITQLEYDEMLAAQNYVCAICGGKDEVDGRALAIDHCHETGKVRGLLCGACNRALGLFRDSPVLLKRAMQYLMAAQSHNPT